MFDVLTRTYSLLVALNSDSLAFAGEAFEADLSVLGFPSAARCAEHSHCACARLACGVLLRGHVLRTATTRPPAIVILVSRRALVASARLQVVGCRHHAERQGPHWQHEFAACGARAAPRPEREPEPSATSRRRRRRRLGLCGDAGRRCRRVQGCLLAAHASALPGAPHLVPRAHPLLMDLAVCTNV